MGTCRLLEASRRYWKQLVLTNPAKAETFRFHHISTDEVFGDLAEDDPGFTEQTTLSHRVLPIRPARRGRTIW